MHHPAMKPVPPVTSTRMEDLSSAPALFQANLLNCSGGVSFPIQPDHASDGTAVPYAEFGENGCDLGARGSLADHEDVGDLLVRVPVSEQTRDLLLSVGEAEGIALSR